MKQNDSGKKLDCKNDPLDVPYNPHDQLAVDDFWKDGVSVQGGGTKSVRNALRKNHHLKIQSTKISTTLCLSTEVLTYFKKSGIDWQDSIDDILMAYVLSHKSSVN
ncbi:MAG: BrnA antitoxin family protein [Thiomargarita sp.]|nr:BrnA antitoxin family protein [Thiomargarita sp.]